MCAIARSPCRWVLLLGPGLGRKLDFWPWIQFHDKAFGNPAVSAASPPTECTTEPTPLFLAIRHGLGGQAPQAPLEHVCRCTNMCAHVFVCPEFYGSVPT